MVGGISATQRVLDVVIKSGYLISEFNRVGMCVGAVAHDKPTNVKPLGWFNPALLSLSEING